MPRLPRHTLAARILARIEQLSVLTEVTGEVTRRAYTKEHKAAVELISRWMREAGLAVELNAAGTLVGRVEGSARATTTLLIGSHIDTVGNASRYDGALGVVMAIEAIAELLRLGRRLPYAVEVLAFGSVEGARFPATIVGARALTGVLAPGMLDTTDTAGVTLADALRTFGCDPDMALGLARRSADILGYVEVHTEQGPVLEDEGLALGVVTAISGGSRFEVDVKGRSARAGMVPMSMRRDALAGAAEMVVAIETIGRANAGLVATVGKIAVLPGASNFVPGHVQFTLDVRSPVERTRRSGVQAIDRQLRAIARRRHLTVKVGETHNEKAAPCDERFIRHFMAAADRLDVATIGLPSGGGHAGLAMSKLCPIGMLFVRCKCGFGYLADETVKADDVEVAARVLLEFLQGLAPSGRTLS